MSEPTVQLIKKSDFLVDIVAVGAFFAFLAFYLLPVHVPANDSTMILIWSVGTAACMSGVFWMALWMFRVVLRYQRALNARRK
jgi:hypothetical protein